MDSPLISVIIPIFNRAELISETIGSVLSQSYRNWECIVVDDGSRDGTETIVKAFTEKDSRIQFYKRPLDKIKGAASCRNFGLEKAKGDFIQYLDSDDLLMSNKFEEQLKLLKEETSTGIIVSCKWGSFNNASQLKVKKKWNSYGNYHPAVKILFTFGKFNEYLPLMTYLIPKELCLLAGPWEESLSYNDDGEYFSRVLLHAKKLLFCKQTEAYYRAGDTERLSLLDNEQKIRSAIESWKMIQKNLISNKKVCRKYFRNGIKNIYEQIKDSHPGIIDEYSEFFEKNVFSRKWYYRFLKN